ncbi:S1 RNA-binding domain-containing protein [Actinacidiphila glaucinigra]|uniref:S1 RNA-binding domain-containing protein n=1 Tax=Actinacidiphila glaucinigra TaxID=235986 RepID=UPI002DDC8882|nr:S1 RNA-binding domain-containing protein [Actinacidiphila glaucinigra]WSD58193.1 S1 RNA-binding domain-containing protein [Actinacidiphila glaucinigra]
MSESSEDQACREFLTGIQVGDVCDGTVAEATHHGVTVTLDGFPARPLGTVGSQDLSWTRRQEIEPGQRITARVLSVDVDAAQVRLSTTATENPELWSFLGSLRPGERMTGTIASIERFGVFVALDDGPGHPVFPGVGFITIPELSWRHFEDASEVVRVGEQVTCEFLQFDTTNGEARLSLRATLPDPFAEFADRTAVGRTLRGRVTKLVPFGAFVEVADGVEGLVHLGELADTPVDAPQDVVRTGDGITVVVIEVEREGRRLHLSRRRVRAARQSAG